MTCERCRFWSAEVVTTDGAMGRCRARPPSASLASGWPWTVAADWCGAAEARPVSVAGDGEDR